MKYDVPKRPDSSTNEIERDKLSSIRVEFEETFPEIHLVRSKSRKDIVLTNYVHHAGHSQFPTPPFQQMLITNCNVPPLAACHRLGYE